MNYFEDTINKLREERIWLVAEYNQQPMVNFKQEFDPESDLMPGDFAAWLAKTQPDLVEGKYDYLKVANSFSQKLFGKPMNKLGDKLEYFSAWPYAAKYVGVHGDKKLFHDMFAGPYAWGHDQFIFELGDIISCLKKLT